MTCRKEFKLVLANQLAQGSQISDVPTSGFGANIYSQFALIFCGIRSGRWGRQVGNHYFVTVALTLAAVHLLAGSANAQMGHAYLSVGAGAADLTGGVDVRVGDNLVGIGGEFGLGQLFVGSFTGSLHPISNRTNRPIDPFVTVSLTGLGSSPYSAQGMSVGGGGTAWFSRRLGLRVDGFKFWPVFSEEEVTPAEFSPKLWGARVGLAFRVG